MHDLENLIDDAWQRRADLASDEIDSTLKPAIERVLDALEQGTLRVAEPDGAGGWRTRQWLKKAVLLYFRVSRNRVVDGGAMHAFDKVPLRFAGASEADFRSEERRVGKEC